MQAVDENNVEGGSVMDLGEELVAGDGVEAGLFVREGDDVQPEIWVNSIPNLDIDVKKGYTVFNADL